MKESLVLTMWLKWQALSMASGSEKKSEERRRREASESWWANLACEPDLL